MFAGYFLNAVMPVGQATLATLQKQASPERLQRAMRYRQGDDQARCLLSGSLLNQALKCQGVDEAEQHIRRTRFGKPVLTVNDTQHFNLSHSGSWVVCAVDDQPVGVDVERQARRRGIEFDELFTAEEMDYLKNDKQGSLWQRFYRLWTLKESYLKALGTGMYQSMQSFTVNILDNHHARLSVAGRPQKDWYFYSFEPDGNHTCSICTRRPVRAEQFHFSCVN
ncbi:MAG: hypothetical protein CSA45_05230 [Gammaproteobacteria bacterium]|nr:MAG: hypothetical protein CSA45_05230 [Gammaproteobacteria bacterium]